MRSSSGSKVVALLAGLQLGGGALTAAGAAPDSKAWFEQRTQALFDALTSGDKAIWDQTLDRGCVITTEDGEVEGKEKFLTDLKPLPKGFSGRIKIRDLTLQDFGNTAVVQYWMDEWEDIFDQQLRTTYVETDSYHRSAKTWQIVAMQTTVVPRDLEPLTTDSSAWPALIGEYHFPGDAQIRYRVFARDGQLFGGRDEKSATSLIPLAPLVFHQKGSIHFIIFVKDAAGVVTEVREIHKYNEVRMQRVMAPER
jgi:hypothetical protein